MKIRPQLFVALRMLRLRTIYRAENIGNVLKRVVNVTPTLIRPDNERGDGVMSDTN